MKISALIILLNLFHWSGLANDMVVELNGFRLRQYREAVSKELGSPVKADKFPDGFEYEIYLLKPDTSLYMIFEYSPDNLQLIWSIQITGRDAITGFKELELGMDEADVRKMLGAPARMEDVGPYGSKWEYNSTNYSVEINTKGRLSSIKITDSSAELFPGVDAKKLPRFVDVVKILKSKKNAEIGALLCPDMEVYTADSTYFFRSRMSEEVKKDLSGLFELIRSLSSDLQKVNVADGEQYEENMRVSKGRGPMHVVKIKKGSKIREIVFRYTFGSYLIWEIRS